MAGKIPNNLRDELVSAFRERAISTWKGGGSTPEEGWVPFPHQRHWWAASDGLTIHPGVEDPLGASVRLPDGSMTRWATSPREGGRARVIADLGAFKIGKSMSSGFWASGFAAVPDSRVNLVGLEYDICAPEFDYICDILLSEQGLNLKYDSLQNRPRDGKMWLDLPNGARYEARSWERKESLKGKEIDAYVYCEAYQLPGIEAYTDFSQNLRARQGYAVFPTTPDRPWVQELHNRAHSGLPEWRGWHCTCGVDASVNPFTYDAEARVRDEQLMTREKFAIHYKGQLGDFVGRVFNYQRGQRTFNAESHPHLYRGGGGREHFRLPEGWEVVSGADTGTFYTALTVAFSPDGEAFVLDEYPNYRYVAGNSERDETITIPEWAKGVTRGLGLRGGRPNFWADSNSQFRAELRQYGINLLSGSLPVETRTEITREYFQHNHIWLAPWLTVLPFELENAAWPEEASSSGKFSRVKDRDHTLDCLEHILAKRPRGKPSSSSTGPGRWIDSFRRANASTRRTFADPHLGKN